MQLYKEAADRDCRFCIPGNTWRFLAHHVLFLESDKTSKEITSYVFFYFPTYSILKFSLPQTKASCLRRDCVYLLNEHLSPRVWFIFHRAQRYDLEGSSPSVVPGDALLVSQRIKVQLCPRGEK